jgi:putative NADH-flavin reductase
VSPDQVGLSLPATAPPQAVPPPAAYTFLVEGLRVACVHRPLVVAGAGSLKTSSGW